jgi:hypothetical protein
MKNDTCAHTRRVKYPHPGKIAIPNGKFAQVKTFSLT